jgi:hypothetical protein
MNTLSKQRTLAMMTGFERYTKKTRRAIFLEEMEQVVPWAKLCALIAPHYPQPGWPIVDTSGETVVLVGLAPGPHNVLLELADATHKPIPGASKLVEFIVPAPKGPHN